MPLAWSSSTGAFPRARCIAASSLLTRPLPTPRSSGSPRSTTSTEVDYVDRVALVAVVGGRLVAVGRYERAPGSMEAEVAFVVADDYQHHGLAPLLLDRLADVARQAGIAVFTAETLVENREMMGVFLHSGFPVTTSSEFGTVSVRLSIGATGPALEARPSVAGYPG